MSTREAPDLLRWPTPRESYFDVPAPHLEAMRSGCPVRTRNWDGTEPLMFARHAQVGEVLKQRGLSADVRNPGYPNMNAAQPHTEGGFFHRLDGDEHRRGRGAVNGEFTAARMEALRPRIAELADRQVDELLAAGSPADFVEHFAARLPAAVICGILGVPYSERLTIHSAMTAVTSHDATPEERQAAMGSLFAMLGTYTQQKLTEPGEDLLTRLVRDRVQTGEMEIQDAVRLGVLMIGAGHHTTLSQLSLSLLSLLRNPEQRGLVADGGPDVAKTAVEELLRFWSITDSEPRRVATEDVEIDGHLIRAGESVACSIAAANRDPLVLPEGEYGSLEQVNVLRPGRRHFAFGFGVHQCVGQHLARVEIQEALPLLLRRIPTLELAVSEDDLDFDIGGHVLGMKTLMVQW